MNIVHKITDLIGPLVIISLLTMFFMGCGETPRDCSPKNVSESLQVGNSVILRNASILINPVMAVTKIVDDNIECSWMSQGDNRWFPQKETYPRQALRKW